MDNITVEQAARIIQTQTRDYGVETIPYDKALGKVLAENLFADRDMPPFNRPVVDGIAINYRACNDGLRSFQIKATQAAGEAPIAIAN